MSESLLKNLAIMVRDEETGWSFNRRFVQEERLCGIRVEWLRRDLHQDLCALHNIDPNECDIVKMTVRGISACHRHKKASCDFQVLSCKRDTLQKIMDKELTAGVLSAEREDGKNEYLLKPQFYEEGQIFHIPAGQMHAFFSDPSDSCLTLIGITRPKIRISDEVYFYDMTRIPYVPSLEYARVRIGKKKSGSEYEISSNLKSEQEN